MLQRWLGDVFSHPDSYGLGLIAFKTAVIYLSLVGGLRLFGKREIGQMNIYDLVLIIVLANAVQNAMVGNDTTLGGGLVAAATLLAMNRLMGFVLMRSPRVERFMTGEPALILNDGKVMPERMRKEGITHDQLLAALREHGLDQIGQAQMCVLEVDGTISVVPRDGTIHRTRRRYRALRLL